MGRPSRRGALLFAALIIVWASTTAGAGAQTFAPGPTLQITEAKVRQIGDDLRFGLRFSAPVPTSQLQAAAGRVVCVVLSPVAPTRRSVCVSRRNHRLVATIGTVDAAYHRGGAGHRLTNASIGVNGDFMSLRASAHALKIRLGKPMTWLALLRFNDAGVCAPALTLNADACTQRFPGIGELAFQTKSSSRPLFARQGRLRLLATG
jgi:hypothetical protein